MQSQIFAICFYSNALTAFELQESCKCNASNWNANIEFVVVWLAEWAIYIFASDTDFSINSITNTVNSPVFAHQNARNNARKKQKLQIGQDFTHFPLFVFMYVNERVCVILRKCHLCIAVISANCPWAGMRCIRI